MVCDAQVYADAKIASDFCLAEIPDFQGLLPKANENRVPVFAMEDREIGESGVVHEEMIEKRDSFYALFKDIAEKVTKVVQPCKEHLTNLKTA